MLPASPLLQLVPSRVYTALGRIRGKIWREVARLDEIRATAAAPQHRGFAEASREPLAPVKSPAHWGRLWDQRWFKLAVPAELAKRGDLYLAWDDQAEATLYIDGAPFYGFDVAHKRAPLPRGARELWVESVVCQTGIWHPAATGLDAEGSHFTGARLLERDEAHWSLYHDIEALEQVAGEELRACFGADVGKFGGFGQRPVLNNVSPLLRRVLRALDEALDAYETKGAEAARRRLAQAYRELPASPAATTALLTGHAHIDLVWLWPEKVGEFKAVHTFATANRLFERYPEFRFGYSQPASYEAVGRRSPKLLEAVKKRIREKRWDATGAAEVESDTLLACGEALGRSLLIGQRRFAELRGEPSRLLWLPDVFGYTPCLPQLLRETGVDYFYTTKLSWCALTRFPYSSFVWRGHDGSEVVSHITHEGGYNQEAKAGQLRAGELAHRQSDVHHEFIAPTGYGDGGGGTTEEMCERARRFSNLAGVPQAKWGNLEPFFDRLAAIRGKLPTYQGELYLEYHRGTYTTHGDVKAAMRRAERALQVHEAARCALGGGPLEERAWQRVVFAQFHDYIPGSSIHEVYDEGKAELAAVAEAARSGAARELGSGSGGKGAPALFNPLPRPRTVLLGATKDGAVEAVALAPLAGAPLAELPRVGGLTPVKATSRRLSNGRVSADIDAQGRVSRLVVDGRELALLAPLGELVIYHDRPAMFEAWDIDRAALSLGEPVRSKATLKLEHADAARATLACTRSLGDAGEATIRYTLEAGASCLRVEVELNWKREEALLKMLFPTSYAGRQARYGAPFGSVLRSQVPGELADEAKWEVPASRWAAVTDETEGEGLFVVTEAKYGFSCRDGVLGLSLLRSAAITCEGGDSHGKGSHPASLRRTRAASRFSDMGAHRIALAIGLHDAAAPREEQAAALADTLFTAPLEYRGGAVVGAGLLAVEGGETLHPVWAKPADPISGVAKKRAAGAWVLRLNETLGRRGRAVVKLAPGWRARRVNLLEQPEAAAGVRATKDGSTVQVDYTPYALISLMIERA